MTNQSDQGGGAAVPSEYSPAMANLAGELFPDMPIAGTGAKAGGPQVWLGGSTHSAYDAGPAGYIKSDVDSDRTTQVRNDKTIAATVLIERFQRLPIKDKMAWARRLLMAGYLGPLYSGETFAEALRRFTMDEVEGAYETLIGVASVKWTEGQQRVTPDMLLEQATRYELAKRGLDESAPETSWWRMLNRSQRKDRDAGAAEDPFTGVKTQVDISRDIWSVSEARGLALATIKNALGREPTKEEYEDFIAALQTEQRENPQKTRTRYVYDEGELVRTNSRTTGGVDEEMFAYDQARAMPGYAEWQAIGTYLPTALSVLGAGVPGA